MAELLGCELVPDEAVLTTITQRLIRLQIKVTDSILLQPNGPRGAVVLPKGNGTAPGLYFPAGVYPSMVSPHLFLLPGPPRELRPMFMESALPILRTLGGSFGTVVRRLYKIANVGESVVETAVGARLLAIPGLEVGYCARPGEVDLRLVGHSDTVDRGEAIVLESLGQSIFTKSDKILEEVIVERLRAAKKTVALAESCTGGHLSSRLTNVPGASECFLAGSVPYSQRAQPDIRRVATDLPDKQGALRYQRARATDGAAARAPREEARDRRDCRRA